MLRALIWKEWREQRPLVIAGIALSTLMPFVLFAVAAATMPRFNGQRLADMTVVAFALLMWPMFAASAGAGAMANEMSGRTLGFLLSRPVSRALVWATKVALAATSVLFVMAISMLVARLMHWGAGTPAAADPSLVVLGGDLFRPTQRHFLGVPSLYLCFAVAVFLSGRVARSLAAAIGALAATGLFLTMLAALWPRVGLISSFRGTWVTTEILFAGTLLLTLSFRRFAAAGAGRTSRFAGTVLVGSAVMVATAVVGFVPALYADTFADLDRAVTRDFAMSFDGTAAVVTAAKYPAVVGSLWRLPDEVEPRSFGSSHNEPLRLTGRPAFAPFFSLDGAWVYYFTASAPWGVPGGEADLRAVRIDGSEDRLVIESVETIRRTSRQGWPVSARGQILSASGSMAAFEEGWWGGEALVLDLKRGTARKIGNWLTGDVDSTWETGTPVGWTQEGELVFHVTRRRRTNSDSVQAIVKHDVETGRTETLLLRDNAGEHWEFPRLWFPFVAPRPHTLSPQIPIQVYTEQPPGDRTIEAGVYELARIDVDTGEIDLAERFPCGHPFAAVAGNGNVVAHRRFRSCLEEEDGGLIGTDPILVVRDLEAGVVEEFDHWGEELGERTLHFIRVSPRGERVSVSIGHEMGPSGFHILDGDRSVRTLELRRFVDGVLTGPRSAPEWIDDDHVLVRYRARGPTRYLIFALAVVFNVDDGTVAHEFIIPPADPAAR